MATAIDDTGPWVLWEGQVHWTQPHLDEATKKYKSWQHVAMCKIVIDQYGQLSFLQGWESDLPGHTNWHLAADMGEVPIQHIADQALRELFRKSREQAATINADERVEALETEITELRTDFDRDFAEVSAKSVKLEVRSKELLRDAESLRAQLKAKTEEAASWQRRFEETQREPAAEAPLPKQDGFDPAREIESGSVVGAVLEYLHDHGPTYQSELPALIKRSGGAVSTAKQRLIYLGWVKDEDYKLSLTREIPGIGPPTFCSIEAEPITFAATIGGQRNGDSD